MTVSALLKQAVPLTQERHGKTFIDPVKGYGFAREMTFVPVLSREFGDLASDYVVAFIKTGEDVRSVALLGLAEGENLYLAEDDSWKAAYVPAMLRQYPFVAMMDKGSENGVLAIAEDYAGLNKDGQGEPLFDWEGRPGDLVSRAQKFVADVAQGALRTEAICARLADLDLLSPIRVELKNAKGEARRIGGVMVVDRKKLNALDAETLHDLQQSGMLEAIYEHLHSMRNLRSLAERITPAPSGALN
ncbi:SapC family protein [Marimonas lutisalis]|uniref:SapC family protein n=1 Tax=Marimonas lutisalis TaxID=2545756 RepID=UPI0010F779EF|nr:SapC family protein [Marimonas lutisalis]